MLSIIAAAAAHRAATGLLICADPGICVQIIVSEPIYRIVSRCLPVIRGRVSACVHIRSCTHQTGSFTQQVLVTTVVAVKDYAVEVSRGS